MWAASVIVVALNAWLTNGSAGHLAQPEDLLRREQTALLMRVGHDHVGRIALHDLENLVLAPRRLIGADRDAARAAHVRHPVEVEHRDRLLDVLDHEGSHAPQDADGGAGAPALVRVDADLRPGPDRLAHAPDELDVTLLLDRDLEVDRPEPAADRVARLLDHGVEIALRLDVVHRCERCLERAAEEGRDGLAEVLADRVPARHLESAEDERRRAVERVPARAEDAVDEALRRERRVADEQLRPSAPSSPG